MKFELDREQTRKAIAWFSEQHEKVLAAQRESEDPFIKAEAERGIAYYGAIGGEITYSFTPTALGVVVKIKHAVTGNELDLTDYDSW
jgi:hypothetical protein